MSARRILTAAWVASVLFTLQPVLAQESRAVVVGRVTDSSGAVIPDASIAFTNVETAVARSVSPQ
jgi:hypothetical protein